MSALLSWTLGFSAVGLAASAFMCLERMRRGPTIMDRILAFDTICVMIVGMMVILSMAWSSSDYLDLILVFTLLGFFSTIAFSLYLHRTYVRHDPEAEAKARRAAERHAKAAARKRAAAEAWPFSKRERQRDAERTAGHSWRDKR